MFGESDSESPRLSSPWEAFSTSPSPCPGLASSLSSSVSSSDIEAELARRLQTEVPKLVPEVEEGNVEYKLKLSPSPERLTRLITQLKWRLLEGGGQALYEIGVGDGGQLVGLPRHEMERSLDALERMAGELGATVVILREIAVPRGVVANTLTEEGDGGLLGTPPDFSRSTTGSGDEFEAFSLELDGEDTKSRSTSWHAQAQTHLPNSNWPHKTGRRGQKAEHKKVRRAVKRSVNAAFATNTRISPGALDVPQVVVSSVVPPALDLPEAVIDSSLADIDAVAPFEASQRSAKSTPDLDEIIIVEALVVRKLALEEAFLDFGGFSVLG
ncbi:hypothetical protein RSOLAG22IIIB_06986 [Rhizoctonia solani]|uniref:GTP-binding protein 2 n=1 Tax=Rhizoctonia solani TaxID=456999 RepID=A0A0K6GIT2_9AGAM|nr:hypothetical protein RSOLAG22IIIB_06986 [Rhizoctonia solani]